MTAAHASQREISLTVNGVQQTESVRNQYLTIPLLGALEPTSITTIGQYVVPAGQTIQGWAATSTGTVTLGQKGFRVLRVQ